MAFQSLYRKHRPQSFSELVGQEPVATALRNAVREGRIGHAYLFSGPRGTGKTTTARLLAKALNCHDRRPDGEPCNACPSCAEIAAGTSMDVLELDAASNRGVAEMRALLERVAYRSAGGARKVYIVDEVHMLTKEASTALLKTLEEPPGHVIFLLATTDPQMVLSTIRSRTQHFEFSLLPADQLAAHLADVAAREGVETDSDVLAVIARRAGGSARDALSFLDQALAYGEGKLVADQVRSLLGGTPFGARAAIVDAVGAGDVPALLERLDGLLAGGMDARSLADDLLRHLRDAFLVSAAGDRVRVDAPPEELDRLKTQGNALGPAVMIRALEHLGEAGIEIRRAPDPRLVLEVALVRLAGQRAASGVPTGPEDAAGLADRIARLERVVDELRQVLAAGRPPSPAPPAPPAPAAGAGEPERRGPKAALGALRARAGGGGGAPPAPAVPEPAEPRRQERPSAPAAPPAPEPEVARPPAAAGAAPAGELTLDEITAAWTAALAACKPRLRAMATEARPLRVEGTRVVLGLPDRFSQFHLPSLRSESGTLAGVLSAQLGRAVTVDVVIDDSPATAGPGAGSAGETVDHADDIDEPRVAPGGGGLDSPVGLAIRTFEATIESETLRE